jgi:hypothetical protein
MSNRAFEALRAARRMTVALLALLLVGALCRVANAQAGGGTTVVTVSNRVVGGVSIDTNGVLQNATTEHLGVLGRLRAQALEKIPGELGTLAELRKVSFRRLEAALSESLKDKKDLPDAIKYLAGLQQIRYVFVYPEQNDIVLVGPAEGWKVDAKGNVVGQTTGRAVMLLDDLVVALRTARQAAQGGISCSIDPTEEGLARLQQLTSSMGNSVNIQARAAGMEQALGMQRISISGVPPGSHFARVLVAADYRMKRIGMNFEPAPVRGLPSYLQMVKASTRAIMTPRWWLEPKYEPLLRDADGLAWELRGASVKAVTQEDSFSAAGHREQTGKANPAAQKWADLMTEKYPELAVADPIFAQLQNCMELAIVAALVTKEGLAEKAGYSMPLLLDPVGVKTEEYPAAKTVESKASVLRKGSNWVISASGGVLVNSWGIADKTQKSTAPTQLRAKAAPAEKTAWWWN